MRGALILGACTALALAASAYLAAAEDAPKDNQGYTTQKALSKEIPSMAGWQLRLRVLFSHRGPTPKQQERQWFPSFSVYERAGEGFNRKGGESGAFDSAPEKT